MIFSPFFEAREVTLRLEAEAIEIPAFLATSEMIGLEDLYYQKPLHGQEVLVLQVDATRTIQKILPFRDYIDGLFQ